MEKSVSNINELAVKPTLRADVKDSDLESIPPKQQLPQPEFLQNGTKPVAPQNMYDYAANTLAFVGDAVFTLFIRRHLATLNLKAGELTCMAARQVSATSQSAMLDKIMDILTDSEKDIVRRCRNAHTNNHAKNASIIDYRRATGLEGLIGHLYLSGDSRLEMILNRCVADFKA